MPAKSGRATQEKVHRKQQEAWCRLFELLDEMMHMLRHEAPLRDPFNEDLRSKLSDLECLMLDGRYRWNKE